MEQKTNIFGKFLSYTLKGIILLFILLFILIAAKIVDRWNKPMQIPEAHGMTYGELIQNRIDGWNHNEEVYNQSTLRCKVLWLSGATLSIPLQISYTYISYYPDSIIIRFLDQNDIKEGFIPNSNPGNSTLSRWWWTVEKFTWGVLVEGVESTPAKTCALSRP